MQGLTTAPEAAQLMKMIAQATEQGVETVQTREENRQLKEQLAQMNATLGKVVGIVTNLSVQVQVLQEQNKDLKTELAKQKEINAEHVTREQQLQREINQQKWQMSLEKRYRQLKKEQQWLELQDVAIVGARLLATVLAPAALAVVCPPAGIAATFLAPEAVARQNFSTSAGTKAFEKEQEAAKVKAELDQRPIEIVVHIVV